MFDNYNFIRRIRLFEGLDEEDVTSLASLFSLKQYKKGSTIFFEGDAGDALYVVQSGYVKIYQLAEDGREKTLALFGEGDFFGEMAILDGEPRSAIAETLEKTELLVLERHDFMKMVDANPRMSAALIKELAGRLRRTNAQVMDVVFRDVRGRLIHALIDLAEDHGIPSGAGIKIDLKLTHQELANLVGTARETVTRMLAELQDAGIVTIEGRFLVVPDPAELNACLSA